MTAEELRIRILGLIAEHDGDWNWYQLAYAINPCDLPSDVTVFSTLRELEEQRLVESVQFEHYILPIYRLTDAGLAAYRGVQSVRS